MELRTLLINSLPSRVREEYETAIENTLEACIAKAEIYQKEWGAKRMELYEIFVNEKLDQQLQLQMERELYYGRIELFELQQSEVARAFYANHKVINQDLNKSLLLRSATNNYSVEELEQELLNVLPKLIYVHKLIDECDYLRNKMGNHKMPSISCIESSYISELENEIEILRKERFELDQILQTSALGLKYSALLPLYSFLSDHEAIEMMGLSKFLFIHGTNSTSELNIDLKKSSLTAKHLGLIIYGLKPKSSIGLQNYYHWLYNHWLITSKQGNRIWIDKDFINKNVRKYESEQKKDEKMKEIAKLIEKCHRFNR